MWSSASPRCWAAATAISSRSLTFAWPVKSEKRDGRNVSSNATSGLFNVEIGRSAIARQNARTPNQRQGERGIDVVKGTRQNSSAIKPQRTQRTQREQK